MDILISTEKFDNSTQSNGFFVSNQFDKIADCSYLLIGELYSHQPNDLISHVIDGNTAEFESIIGDFSLIVLPNSKPGTILFLNDRAGRNILYYSTKQGLTISADFWSIIEHDRYNKSDIDILAFKTQTFFSATSDYSTFLKGLKIFPNAVYASLSEKEYKISKYWHFSLKPNQLTSEEKYNLIDDTFRKCFKEIKKNNPKDTAYGIGISGGLDSRLIPYYALKENLKLESFITGQEKPNKFFVSNDHRSSRRIAEYFKLNHQQLEFDELSYSQKMKLDVDFAPICSSQIFKIPNLQSTTFDVLLTGASGFYVGSSPFYSKIRGLSIEEMVCVQQSDLYLRRKFYRVKKGLNYIFGKRFEINPTPVKHLPGIISEEEIAAIREKIMLFFNEIKHLSKTEQLMNYAVSVLGQRNRSGSFESLINHKKDYTPYFPFFIDIVQNWTEEDIYDRKLFEDFIRVKLPQLAAIEGQDYKTPLSKKNPNRLDKILSLIRFAIRGTGVMNYPRWAKQRKFKQFVISELERADYISDFFDIEPIKKLTYNERLDSTVLTGILKLNRCIHKMEELHNNKKNN